MGKRGPRSKADLSVVRDADSADSHEGRLPDPPPRLSPAAAELWRVIVRSKPAGWFTPDTDPILEAYCQHATSAAALSERIAEMEYTGEHLAEIDTYAELLKLRDRETRAAESRARSMRLTHQARYMPDVAARKAKQTTAAAKRPWE